MFKKPPCLVIKLKGMRETCVWEQKFYIFNLYQYLPADPTVIIFAKVA